jgi:ABC-type bacteriocin/lantibiotic exporter with double-glycine peptidase domain
VRATIKYSVIRVVIFAIVLAVLLLLHVNVFLATILAAAAGFALSYIFFRKVRNQMALELAARSKRDAVTVDADTNAEDEVLDRLSDEPAAADSVSADNVTGNNATANRATADRAAKKTTDGEPE